jgi:CelD/BcsL family acetyltransferase involved in cellulose biosynthesis
VKVEIHCSSDIFDALRPEWNALLKQSASDTLFLTWEFQQTWWDHFGAGCELRVVTVRDDDGRLVGLAPLYKEREGDQQVLRLIGGVEVADYLDIVTASERQDDVLSIIFAALCEMGDWRVLDLRNLPTASPTRAAYAALAAQRNFQVMDRVEEVCPIIALPSTFDDYLETLDKKQRHEIRRKLRKAHTEAEIKWYMAGPEHDLTETVNHFIELHQRSKADKDDFMTPTMMNFFHALARATYDAGWLELAFIEVNGQRAATYFDFRYNMDTLCYNSGYDPQAYAAVSPGIVLLSHLIEHSIASGAKRFDFLQGNETYKYRMGAQDTQVYQLTIQRV